MTEPEWLESLADLPRAPRCEFCGDTEGPLFRSVPMAPLLCLFCDMRCALEMEPRLVLNIGSVVARAAGLAVAS